MPFLYLFILLYFLFLHADYCHSLRLDWVAVSLMSVVFSPSLHLHCEKLPVTDYAHLIPLGGLGLGLAQTASLILIDFGDTLVRPGRGCGR